MEGALTRALRAKGGSSLRLVSTVVRTAVRRAATGRGRM